jgi:NhaC family Na+:H+ antiporter
MRGEDLPEVAAFLTLFTLAMLVAVAFLHYPVYSVLLLGGAGAAWLGWRHGFTPSGLARMFVSGALQALPVVIIISLIGMLIGVWKAGRVIPAFMNLSFDLLRPQGFLVTVFLVSTAVALLLGTATGTFSTIGLVLAGVGAVTNVPYPVVVGAIVSGAFVGDRSAPLSATANLVATLAECEPRALLRHLWTTGAPAVLLSAAFYFLLDQIYSQNALNAAVIAPFRALIASHFRLSGWLYLPPLLFVLLAVARVATHYNIAIVLLSSALVAGIVQGLSPVDLVRAAISGYHASGSGPAVQLLNGGGLLAMLPLLITLFAATGLGGLLEGTGMTRLVLGRLLERAGGAAQLLVWTVGISAAVVVITANQALSVVIPARLLLEPLRRKGAGELALARAIADAGAVLAPIVPWTTAALTPALLLGVEARAFIPFAAFCWLQPLIELLFLRRGSFARTKNTPNPTADDGAGVLESS